MVVNTHRKSAEKKALIIRFSISKERTRMRWGPFTSSNSCKYARIEMDCSVFPRPISSARIPLMPFSWFRISQFKPSSWYGRMAPWITEGCFSSRVPPLSSVLFNASESPCK